MTTASHTPLRKDRSTVTTAPPTTEDSAELHVVTEEESVKARKAVAELEQIERLVTTILLVLGVGGLIFTAVNVTLFAIDHDVSLYIAWMLDPLVSASLLAALYVDGKLAEHGYKPGGWPFLLRWFAGLATWLMNCWGALYPDGQFTGWPDRPDPAALLLHSVVPMLVVVLAEAGAGYRKFSTKKKAERQKVLTAWQDQKEARRREAAEKREREEERNRDSAEAEQKRAAEARRENDRIAAEARKVEAEGVAKARLAEQDRLAAEARLRGESEARFQQARIDRETAAHAAELARKQTLAEAQAQALTVEAEGRSEAERLRAEAEVKAREAKRAVAEARRTATAVPAVKATALPAERTALPEQAATAETRKPTAVPAVSPSALSTAEADDVRGAEAKRKQIEEATFEAAVLLSMDVAPTRKDFATQYGRGETWGRERYADAERLMAEDTDFAARVSAEKDSRNSILTTAT